MGRRERRRQRVQRVLARYPGGGLVVGDLCRLANVNYGLLMAMEREGRLRLDPPAGAPLAPDRRIRAYPSS